MAYELIGRVSAEGRSAQVICNAQGSSNATITVTGATSSQITWVGDTEYDMSAGDASHGFSFKGQIPHTQLLSHLTSATSSSTSASYASLLSTHMRSYQTFLGGFSLSLNQKPDISRPTNELKSGYKTDVGDPYLEWLLFNFGRYLLTASAPGILPANLQGKWSPDLNSPWGAGQLQSILERLHDILICV